MTQKKKTFAQSLRDGIRKQTTRIREGSGDFGGPIVDIVDLATKPLRGALYRVAGRITRVDKKAEEAQGKAEQANEKAEQANEKAEQAKKTADGLSDKIADAERTIRDRTALFAQKVKGYEEAEAARTLQQEQLETSLAQSSLSTLKLQIPVLDANGVEEFGDDGEIKTEEKTGAEAVIAFSDYAKAKLAALRREVFKDEETGEKEVPEEVQAAIDEKVSTAVDELKQELAQAEPDGEEVPKELQAAIDEKVSTAVDELKQELAQAKAEAEAQAAEKAEAAEEQAQQRAEAAEEQAQQRAEAAEQKAKEAEQRASETEGQKVSEVQAIQQSVGEQMVAMQEQLDAIGAGVQTLVDGLLTKVFEGESIEVHLLEDAIKDNPDLDMVAQAAEFLAQDGVGTSHSLELMAARLGELETVSQDQDAEKPDNLSTYIERIAGAGLALQTKLETSADEEGA